MNNITDNRYLVQQSSVVGAPSGPTPDPVASVREVFWTSSQEKLNLYVKQRAKKSGISRRSVVKNILKKEALLSSNPVSLLRFALTCSKSRPLFVSQAATCVDRAFKGFLKHLSPSEKESWFLCTVRDLKARNWLLQTGWQPPISVLQQLLSLQIDEMEKHKEADSLDTIDQYTRLRSLFHIGLRAIPNLTDDEERLGGISEEHNYLKMEQAWQLAKQAIASPTPFMGIQTVDEFQGLANLVKQRMNYWWYLKRMFLGMDSSTHIDLVVKAIQKDIEALGHVHSSRTVTMTSPENPLQYATSFVVAGGTKQHIIVYEFKKVGDEYYFMVHNRGIGVRDFRLHGEVRFTHPITNHEYVKSIVTIRASKQAIQDSEFLRLLIEARFSSDPHLPYDLIYGQFIRSGQGEIVESRAEQILRKLNREVHNLLLQDREIDKIREKMVKLLPFAPEFNFIQLYDTCAESNLTPEKSIAPIQTRVALKGYSIAELIRDLSSSSLHEDALTRRVIGRAEARLWYLGNKLIRGPLKPPSYVKVCQEAQALLASPKLKRSLGSIKASARCLIEDLVQEYDLDKRELGTEYFQWPVTEKLTDEEDNELSQMMHQCRLMTKALERDKRSDEFRKLNRIAHALDHVIQEKLNESFDLPVRRLKQLLLEVFVKMDRDEAMEASEMVTLLNKPLSKIRTIPQNDPKYNKRFWKQLLNSVKALQERARWIPLAGILKRQLAKMARICESQGA